MSADNLARNAAYGGLVLGWVVAHGGNREQAVRLTQELDTTPATVTGVGERWDMLDAAWRRVLADEPQVDTEETAAERLRWLASQLPGGGVDWWERADHQDVRGMLAETIKKHFWGNARHAADEARWIIAASPKVVLDLLAEIDVLKAQMVAIKAASEEVKSCGGKHSDSEGCYVRDLVLGIRTIASITD